MMTDNPLYAQQDSVKVSLSDLNALKDSLEQQSVVIQRQREEMREIGMNLDSLFADYRKINEQRLLIRDDLIDYQQQQINSLRNDVNRKNRQRWIYYGAGILTVTASAYVLNSTL